MRSLKNIDICSKFELNFLALIGKAWQHFNIVYKTITYLVIQTITIVFLEQPSLYLRLFNILSSFSSSSKLPRGYFIQLSYNCALFSGELYLKFRVFLLQNILI